jgi:hypothetical protein
MWVAFAHLCIFALIIFGTMLIIEGHPQKDVMLVFVVVGVVVLVVYVGPFGLLTAGSACLICYGFSRTL